MKKVSLKIEKENNKTRIKNIKFFNLIKTLESGQTFRYVLKDKGAMVVSKNYATYMYQEKSDLIIESVNDIVINYWISFFNLDLDYAYINKELIKINSKLEKIISLSNGVRILHLDTFEAIITFIISANNNMKRIKGSVNLLAERYGKVLDKKENIYSLPDSKTISNLSLDEIRDLKVGFRDKYIKEAAEKISSKEFDIKKLEAMNADDSKDYLMTLKGVGDKVANCIRLFALNKFESFPVDVWIERYMFRFECKNKSMTRNQIEEYAKKKYGIYAGIVQQYMFFYCITELK